MKEELLLEQRIGKRCPFKVPDGYFDRLEGDVMGKISRMPVVEKVVAGRRFHPWAWVACAAAVVAVGVLCFKGVGIGGGEKADAYSEIAVSSPSTDYVMDEMSDYAMLDNDDYYSFIADE